MFNPNTNSYDNNNNNTTTTSTNSNQQSAYLDLQQQQQQLQNYGNMIRPNSVNSFTPQQPLQQQQPLPQTPQSIQISNGNFNSFPTTSQPSQVTSSSILDSSTYVPQWQGQQPVAGAYYNNNSTPTTFPNLNNNNNSPSPIPYASSGNILQQQQQLAQHHAQQQQIQAQQLQQQGLQSQSLQQQQASMLRRQQELASASSNPHLQQQLLIQQQQQQQQRQQQQQLQLQQQQTQLPQPRIPPAELSALMDTLTPEKYATLQPNQQALVRDYINKKKMAQQGSIGIGYPGVVGGSPSATASVSSPGSSTPLSNGINPNAIGSNYGFGRAGPGVNQLQGAAQTIPTTSAGPNSGATSSTFNKALADFYTRANIPFPNLPLIEGRSIDLSKLYGCVMTMGGFAKVHQSSSWSIVLSQLGFDPNSANAHPDSRLSAITAAYYGTIFPFEQASYHSNAQKQQLLAQQQQREAASRNLNSNSGINNAYAAFQASPPASAVIPRSHSRASSFAPGQQPASPYSHASPPVQTLAPPSNTPVGSVVVSEDKKGKGKAIEKKKKTPLPIPKKKSSMPISVPKEEFEDLSSPHTSATATPTIASLPLPDSTNGSPSTSNINLHIPPPQAPTASIPIPLSSHDPNTLIPRSPVVSIPLPSPPKPVLPPRRKRQKIEYIPLSRGVDTYGSWDLGQLEDMSLQVTNRKRPRNAMELGLIDVHSLTMSIRSRLGSEVTFALNSLTLISSGMRTSPTENGFDFLLGTTGDLLEELLELLEETAFGIEDELEEEDLERMKAEKERIPTLVSYRELFRRVTEEVGDLRPDDDHSYRDIEGALCLGPIEVIISIFNIFHQLALSSENARFMNGWSKGKLLDVLVRVASLPLRKDGLPKGRHPLQVTAADSMLLKKNALEVLMNFGVEVRLNQYSTRTATLLFQLLLFFIVDSDRHQDHLYFDLSATPSNSSKMPQPAPSRITHYLDLGLTAFARITLPDSNRFTISKLDPKFDLFTLFESLIHLLPVTEGDFSLVTNEAGLIFAENLAMCLYNLAFLAPTELKLRLRVVPSFTKSLLRVIRRLIGAAGDPAENPFVVLCDRCVATLKLLSEAGGINSSMKEGEDDAPWFGIGMHGDEDDKPKSHTPSGGDRGSVRARQPPSGNNGTKTVPVLIGERKEMFEILLSGAANTFAKLAGAGLIDPHLSASN